MKSACRNAGVTAQTAAFHSDLTVLIRGEDRWFVSWLSENGVKPVARKAHSYVVLIWCTTLVRPQFARTLVRSVERLHAPRAAPARWGSRSRLNTARGVAASAAPLASVKGYNVSTRVPKGEGEGSKERAKVARRRQKTN